MDPTLAQRLIDERLVDNNTRLSELRATLRSAKLRKDQDVPEHHAAGMSPVGTGSTRTLKKLVKWLEQRGRELCAERNTYAAASKLPNEVLLMIFELVKSAFQFVGDWHNITHVCAQWRRVAVRAACLWSRPPTHLHDYTMAMLRRSSTYPLDLLVSPRTQAATTDILFNRDHLRIRSLTIQYIHNIDFTLLGPAPLLRALDIFGGHPSDSPAAAYHLPNQAFLMMTGIQTITLSCVVAPWNTLCISSLTSLTLENVTIAETASWSTFLRGLGSMPMLEYLDLSLPHQSNAPFNTNEPDQMDHTVLPHLRDLNLDMPASVIRKLLFSVKFPQVRYVWIHTHGNDDHATEADQFDYSRMVPAFLKLYSEGYFHFPMERLTLPMGSFVVLDPQAGADALDLARKGDKSYPYFQFYLGVILSDSFLESLGEGLAELPGNPLSTISELELGPSVLINGAGIAQSLGRRLVNARKITFWNCAEEAIIGLTVDNTDSTETVPFPSLEDTTFLDSFNEYEEGEIRPNLPAMMRHCLVTREGRGARRLRKLVSNWDQMDSVYPLAELVDDVQLVECRVDARGEKLYVYHYSQLS